MNEKKGIYGMEIFILPYYGINLFFYVTKVVNRKKNLICVRELETFTAKDGSDVLRYNDEECNFVKKEKDQSYFGELEVEYYCDGLDFYIPIIVDQDSELYCDAKRTTSEEELETGTLTAKMIFDGTSEDFHRAYHTCFKKNIAASGKKHHWA